MSAIKKIAVNTGGGDAPGLNAVIRAVVLAALARGWEVWGIRYGYRGLLDDAASEDLVRMTPDVVRGIVHRGGSILGTANKGNPFEFPVKRADGTTEIVDRSGEVVKNFHRHGFDALVCIAATFGFDTAVSVATEALDRLHTTAESHDRVMVVELMGRYAGWIALHAGLAGGADVILIPEIPFNYESVFRKIRRREESGRHFSIVVVAEGATEVGHDMMTQGPKEIGREVILGGIGHAVGHEIALKTGKETRTTVLGHLQRGGSPTSFDRLLGLRFGTAAIRALEAGMRNVMVALRPPDVSFIPIDEAITTMKVVTLNNDVILTARSLDVCLGD